MREDFVKYYCTWYELYYACPSKVQEEKIRSELRSFQFSKDELRELEKYIAKELIKHKKISIIRREKQIKSICSDFRKTIFQDKIKGLLHEVDFKNKDELFYDAYETVLNLLFYKMLADWGTSNDPKGLAKIIKEADQLNQFYTLLCKKEIKKISNLSFTYSCEAKGKPPNTVNINSEQLIMNFLNNNSIDRIAKSLVDILSIKQFLKVTPRKQGDCSDILAKSIRDVLVVSKYDLENIKIFNNLIEAGPLFTNRDDVIHILGQLLSFAGLIDNWDKFKGGHPGTTYKSPRQYYFKMAKLRLPKETENPSE